MGTTVKELESKSLFQLLFKEHRLIDNIDSYNNKLEDYIEYGEGFSNLIHEAKERIREAEEELLNTRIEIKKYLSFLENL